MIQPLQVTSFPRIGPQQATAMQASTLPSTTASINISELLNLMITMMIVVMVMKMMTGAIRDVV